MQQEDRRKLGLTSKGGRIARRHHADCWRDGSSDVAVTDILAVMQANADLARATLHWLAGALPPTREPSPIDRVLDSAIITPREHWSPAATARLDAVAGRLLKEAPQVGDDRG